MFRGSPDRRGQRCQREVGTREAIAQQIRTAREHLIEAAKGDAHAPGVGRGGGLVDGAWVADRDDA